MEEKIIDVLRASGRPMKALDIARAIGCEKRDVNRVVHYMREVERSNPGVNPPLWQLYTGSVLTTTSPPLQPQTTAAASGHTSTSSGTRGQGEHVPRSDNLAGLGDQMSRISIGDGASATWDNKLLATIEKDGEGFVVRPIPREVILNRGSGDCGDATERELRHPVQETCSNEEKETTSSSIDSRSKVNPINLSSGHEMIKEMEKETSENDPKRKEYVSQIFDRTLQETRKSYSEVTQASVLQQSSSSQANSKTKKKPTIAANFSGAGDSSTTLKQQILEILKNEKQALDSFMIAQRLGYSTRLEAMTLLHELKHEGRVNKVVKNEVSYWSIRV